MPNDWSAIQHIRTAMKATGCASHTSDAYQDDILRFLRDPATPAGDVIEIGCYLGGLTAQLALACSLMKKRLYVVDISVEYMTRAMNEINTLGLCSNIVFFTGGLESFLEKQRFAVDPCLCVIDGDHRYDGVVSDIRAMTKYVPNTRNIVFHDFSLRYTEQSGLSNVRVDKAILDTLKGSAVLVPFGEIAGKGSVLKTVPGDDGHYHEQGVSEGVLVKLK